jgi:hypothetical protein
MLALDGIQTHDPSNQAAADLRLRQRGHRVQHRMNAQCHKNIV